MAKADEVRTKIQGLIDKANATTGGADTTLAGAMDALAAGYGSDPVLTDLTVTENGEYTPDEGVDGFGKVTVEVETAGGENPLDYARNIEAMFQNVDFGGGKEFTVSIGSKSNSVLSANSFKGLFQDAVGLKSIKIIYEGLTASIYCSNAFSKWADEELEVIDLTQAVDRIVFSGGVAQMFYGRYGLREILGDLDFSQTTQFNNLCGYCYALETIRFKAGTIPKTVSFSHSDKLTDDSVQSIIDGLADLTGGTAQTLTLHATVGAKLTDEQKAAASAKNWTISY